MSHLTHLQTNLQSLFYLKKALGSLNLSYNVTNISNSDSNVTNKTLVIPQSNNYDIKFVWNENRYELATDMSFWDQPYSVKTFINKISQNYAYQVVLGEGFDMGFELTDTNKNTDGSRTLILERWHESK